MLIRKTLLLGLTISLLGACGSEVDSTPKGKNNEQENQQEFNNTLISFQGSIVNNQGEKLAGVQLSLNSEETLTTTSDSSGNFIFSAVPRKNALLQVSTSGYRTENIAVHLLQPTSITSKELGAIILTPEDDKQVRFLFGGDVAFGRRYIDSQELTPRGILPPDDPEALIQVSNPEPGTKDALQWIKPHYQEADFSVLNLETPVTDNPVTPHLTKPYAFFTLTRSLPALTWLGVDYVSLGNNHLYDYLEQGTIDTLDSLNLQKIPYSGAGLTSTEAFLSKRQTLKGKNYSLFSATSIDGHEHEINYVASEIKGGAADLTDTEAVKEALQKEKADGQITIAQLHTGNEYTYQPNNYVNNRFKLALDNGASFAVGHHPHVAQGIALYKGKIAIHSLGNLAFDQDRQETFLGLMARVDMEADEAKRVRLLPVYIEDYRPRLIAGNLANIFLRRIGEFSHEYGATVYPYQGQGWLSLSDDDTVEQTQTVTTTVTIDSSGSSIVDLRELIDSDMSLSTIKASSPLTMSLGRDIMYYGDFEDFDTDENQLEANRWDHSSESLFVCLDKYRGTSAMCSSRMANNVNDSVLAYRNRIRVMGDSLDKPNKNLSLFGYLKGENAGKVTIISRYYASEGDIIFGEEVAFEKPEGSYDWQSFSSDLTLPDEVPLTPEQIAAEEILGTYNARAVRIFIRHATPELNEGSATFDNLALISWEEAVEQETTIATPHSKDFLKITGTPGEVTLTLTFTKYLPTVSQ